MLERCIFEPDSEPLITAHILWRLHLKKHLQALSNSGKWSGVKSTAPVRPQCHYSYAYCT